MWGNIRSTTNCFPCTVKSTRDVFPLSSNKLVQNPIKVQRNKLKRLQPLVPRLQLFACHLNGIEWTLALSFIDLPFLVWPKQKHRSTIRTTKRVIYKTNSPPFLSFLKEWPMHAVLTLVKTSLGGFLIPMSVSRSCECLMQRWLKPSL